MPLEAVLDAAVLVQEPIRSLLLWASTEGIFEPRWSDRILEETRRNLIKLEAVDEEGWERLLAAMTHNWPDAPVDQQQIDAIEDQMPSDEEDRHVLAAAVVSGAGLVVTNNLKDFKPADVAKVIQRAISADEFLSELLVRAPVALRTAIKQQVAHMRNTDHQWTIEELLGRLAGLGDGDPLAPVFAEAAANAWGIKPVAPPPKPSKGGPQRTAAPRRSQRTRPQRS